MTNPPMSRNRRPDNGRDTLVLCYHAVSRQWPAELAVHPDAFQRQLELLLKRGYRGVTMSEAVHGEAIGRRVALTFDDAYTSVFDLAFPLLQRHGVPATVFVPTAFPGHHGPMRWPGIDVWLDGPHQPELECISWGDLRTLARSGWEIGSHTKTHPDLRSISDVSLMQELVESRERCREELGGPCETIAYPYGFHDERVVEAARRAGFTSACTMPTVLGSRDPLTWPRVGIYRSDGLGTFQAKISPTFRRLRSLAAMDPAMSSLRAAARLRRRLRPPS